MAETRVTIVIANDPDAGETSIRALGDHFLPAPVVRPTRGGEGFREAWLEFGTAMERHLQADTSQLGPWQR